MKRKAPPCRSSRLRLPRTEGRILSIFSAAVHDPEDPCPAYPLSLGVSSTAPLVDQPTVHVKRQGGVILPAESLFFLRNFNLAALCRWYNLH